MSWKGGMYYVLHRHVDRGTDRSDRDRSRERSCEGKIPHDTWAEAEQHVLEIIEFNIANHRAHKSARLHAYLCRYCGRWHVGHGRGPEAAG